MADSPPYLSLIFVCSLVVTAAGIAQCRAYDDCSKDNGWAVSCGAISSVLALVLLVFERVSPGVAERLTPLASLFLSVWWAAGAGVCTFRGPFIATGNGYFACWISFLASVALAATKTSTVSSMLSSVTGVGDSQSEGERHLSLCFVASVVELVAAGTLCHQFDNCTEERAWAVAAGVLGLVTSLVFYICHRLSAASSALQKIFSIILLLIWIPGAGISTFSPLVFSTSGNGFFACWVAFVSSVFYAGGSFPPIQNAIERARLSITSPPQNLNLPPSELPGDASSQNFVKTQAPPAEFPPSAYPPTSNYPPSNYPPPAPMGYQPTD